MLDGMLCNLIGKRKSGDNGNCKRISNTLAKDKQKAITLMQTNTFIN